MISYITRTTYFFDIFSHGQPLTTKLSVDKPHTTQQLLVWKFFNLTTYVKLLGHPKKPIFCTFSKMDAKRLIIICQNFDQNSVEPLFLLLLGSKYHFWFFITKVFVIREYLRMHCTANIWQNFRILSFIPFLGCMRSLT